MVLHKGLWAGSAVSERGRGGEGSMEGGSRSEQASSSNSPPHSAARDHSRNFLGVHSEMVGLNTCM